MWRSFRKKQRTYVPCRKQWIIWKSSQQNRGLLYSSGWEKNLIITANGENISPEEIENKLSENRLVQEVLVRDNNGTIEAEIFPDYEYAGKKKIKDIQGELQKIIDQYNANAPLYKRVFQLKVRETEFEKNTTKKIKRF